MRLAHADEMEQVAELAWHNGSPQEQAAQSLAAFMPAFADWCAEHQHTHLPVVAELEGGGLVGMAWLVVVPRVPRPGDLGRRSADLQSVFVLPEHRSRGIGSAIVRGAIEHAAATGILRVTVHSGTRAIPLYERLGFARSPKLMQVMSV